MMNEKKTKYAKSFIRFAKMITFQIIQSQDSTINLRVTLIVFDQVKTLLKLGMVVIPSGIPSKDTIKLLLHVSGLVVRKVFLS